MDDLPVEVIGHILSRLEAARDVSLASVTCGKWRKAGCRYLRSLSFHHADWHGYERMSAAALEVVITRTVLQTTALRRLTICFENLQEAFPPALLVAWLKHTRHTLRSLTYIVQSSLSRKVLKICGRHKLESLVLGHVTVPGNGFSDFQTFNALSSLTLSQVKISAGALNLLLAGCFMLKTLALTSIDAVAQPEDFELSSYSVQAFYLDGIISYLGFHTVFKFDNLKVLSVKHSCFHTLEVVSKGNLRVLSMDHVGVCFEFDLGQCKHLEAVHVVDCNIDDMWPRLYSTISGACCLTRLKLWGVPLPDENVGLDLGEVAVCCPQLYEVSLGVMPLPDLRTVAGSSGGFDRVCSLEVSPFINVPFASWLQEVVERCSI